MFEAIGHAAEKAAASVPRRQFLGRLGRGAALLAGTLGGILWTAGPAEARDEYLCCLTYRWGEGHCGKGRCSPGQEAHGGQTVPCSWCPQ